MGLNFIKKSKYLSIIILAMAAVLLLSGCMNNSLLTVKSNPDGQLTPNAKSNSDSQLKWPTSIYAGTYEGKFDYEYNPTCPQKMVTAEDGSKYDTPDGTGWIPATLTLRVKFESVHFDPEISTPSDSDRTRVFLMNIWIDDPDFGTGKEGIAPMSKQYQKLTPAAIRFPYLPRDKSDPAHLFVDTDGVTRKDSMDGITFNIPDPQDLAGSPKAWVGIYGTGLNSFYISDDAKILHSNPTAKTETGTDDTWSAWVTIGQGSGPLSQERQMDSFRRKCQTRFTSWTLTKISD